MAAVGGASSASYGWAYGVHTRMLVAFSLDGTATLPDQPDPRVQLGILLEESGNSAAAEKAYREALARAPDHPVAKRRLRNLMANR